MSRENPTPPWTYQMAVSPGGQGQGQPPSAPPGMNDPVGLLHLLINLQGQQLDLQRQQLEMQRQELELCRETAQIARDQRARQVADLERWQHGHDAVIDRCKKALGQLEQVHSALMGELADYADENLENLIDGDFALSDFVDRFGPRLAHLNTMLAVLRPLAAATKKAEGGG